MSVYANESQAAADMSAKAESLLTAATNNLEMGLTSQAFSSMSSLWEYPGEMLRLPGFLPRALHLLADIFKAADPHNSFTSIVQLAASDSGSLQSLYDLGVGLVEESQFKIAATVLLLAHEKAPGDPILFTELITTLTKGEQHEEAIRRIQAATRVLGDQISSRSQLVWNAIMVGNLELAREASARLRKACESDASFVEDANYMDSMLLRADSLQGVCKLDRRDLRGWHYVLNGGLLLHLSPHGFDEGMNGRYCFVQDSASQCHDGIQRLKAVLEKQGVRSPRVFVLPERKSSILAHALANALSSETMPWPEGGSQERGIIVAYDLELLDSATLQSIRLYSPGQLLWAHALCWTDPVPWLPRPDFVTFLYQTLVSPWDPSAGARPSEQESQTKEDKNIVPKNLQKLSSQILDAEVGIDSNNSLQDMPTLFALAQIMEYQQPKEQPGLSQFRSTQIPRSPVLSSRF